MWTIRTIILTKEDLQKGEVTIDYLSQYGDLLRFSLNLNVRERIIVDLSNEYFKIEQNKITFDPETFPVKLLVGDEFLINLCIDIELFLKIYSISLEEVVVYLTSPDLKERLLAEFRLRRSKEEMAFWQQINSLQNKTLFNEDY